MPHTGRQSKRPFQPNITSYFHPNQERPSALSRPNLSSRQSSPVLPAAVQSSLLNVGMRIRKSVPEGYKTKEVSNPTSKPTFFNQSASSGTGSHGSIRPRELAPFCGILKVGGYDCQQTTSSYSPEVEDIPALEYDTMDGDSLPASSQESIATIPPPTSMMTVSVRPSYPNKRLFQDNDENDSTDLVIYEDEEVALSGGPGWCSQANVSTLDTNMSRPLAQPKTRRKGGLGSPPSSKWHAVNDDQENTRRSATTSLGVLDFEEATFLQPSELGCNEMDMDEP